MTEFKVGEFGVIKFNGQYVAHSILGTKEDGQFVLFPPLVVPSKDVIEHFQSEVDANLWIAKKRISELEFQLSCEKMVHIQTKQKLKAAFNLLKTYEGDI